MRLLIVLYMLLHTCVALASGPAARFDRLSIEDGLSQNVVRSVLQDRQGFMWFGTMDGLNRYDGYQFKVFRRDPQDSGSLNDNTIGVLYEDSKGTLWVGTESGGLSKYNRDTQRFEHYQHQPDQPNSLSHNEIWAIFEDAQGRLWVGTEMGLNRYDGQIDGFERFGHDVAVPNSLSDDRVRSIYQDSSETLWIGTYGGGLNRFDPATGGFEHFRHNQADQQSLSNDNVRTIYQQQPGTLWVGTEGGGLNRFDILAGQFRHFKNQPGNMNSLSNDDVWSIRGADSDFLWIGTQGGGLNRFNRQTLRFERFSYDVSDRNSLSNDNVVAIYPDNTGALWIGTYDGVSRLDARTQRFGHILHLENDPDSLSDNRVRSFFEDSKGTLWVGTDNGGLNQYQPQSGRFKAFKNDENDPHSLTQGNIWAIYEDSAGLLWVGTDNGLDRFDSQNQRFEHFQHDPTNPHSLRKNHIRTIFEDSQNTLWIGTYGGGLSRFDKAKQQFNHLQHDVSNPKSLSDDYVRVIYEDSKGTMWVGTYGAGLNRYNRQTDDFSHFTHQSTDPHSLSHNTVMSIFEDVYGTLWVGTYGGGLNQFDPKTERFKYYRERDGLPNDTVYSIVPDGAANLWLSTNKGLSKFNPATGTFKNYDVNDGLQSNEFNQGAYYKSAEGELFFGGINGFNRFFPEQVKDDTQLPTIVLSDFRLFNQSVAIQSEQNTNAGLPRAIDQLDALTLNYDQSLISFEFAALHYSNPKQNQYAYRLRGWDRDWIYTSANNRRATYTRLDPGRYTFDVKAANSDGYWNEQGKSLSIVVLPPLWRTWWAYAIYALLLAGLLVGAIVMFKARTKGRERVILLAQLKQVDKLKDEFLANTSHELRTPLNGIIGLAESLIDGVAGPLGQQANDHLSMVVASGRRLSNLVNDILDFAKLKSHILTLHAQPVDLHNITEVVLSLSKHLIGDKKLTLVNKVAKGLPPVAADEQRLQQILYNLVGNGIKFTEQGCVTVSAVQQGSRLSVRIHDDGIGIAQDKFETIFKTFEQAQTGADRRYGGTGLGLAVSKQLIELHDGQIKVESVLGKGSTFSFDLPLSTEKLSTDSSVNHAFDRLQLLHDHGGLEEESLEDEPLPAHLTDYDGSSFRLLLVDDEPINRLVVRNHLSRQNFQIIEAGGGEEALTAIFEDGPFDLVLLDIMMPKVSGYDVCEKIRQTYPVSDLPVIFLSAKNQQVDVVHSFAVGANDYLSKPVSKSELLARVETHLKLLDINRNLEEKVAERTLALEQQHQQIVTTQKQMIESEKMAALGMLMAGVAHEINNPTHFVNACAENLEVDLIKCREFIFDMAGDDADDEILDSFRQKFDPLSQHLITLKDGTERIKTIVSDLKASSNIDGADKQTVKITELLTSTINLVVSQVNKDVELITDFKAEPELACFPAKLSQVFMNLIVNAADALRDKQRQQSEKLSGQIIVGCQQCDQQIEITVKDNGCGMNEETKSKLFEPFYTTKGVVEGTGLGLSISSDIVKKHGGELTVESQLGVGTVFRLLLPL